MPEQEYHSQE